MSVRERFCATTDSLSFLNTIERVSYMAKPIMLTAEGLKQLEEELDNLKTVARKEIAEKIKTARGYGDLSENSEYDEAKNEQAKIEARIVEVEAMLKNVQLIDLADSDHVSIGSTVKVLNKAFNKEQTYKIVGSAEANAVEGKISDESPVGKALIGHAAGDEVTVTVPSGGTMEFTVLELIK